MFSVSEKLKDNLTDEVLKRRKEIKDAMTNLITTCKSKQNEGILKYTDELCNKIEKIFNKLGISEKYYPNKAIIKSGGGNISKMKKRLLDTWKKAKKYVSPKKYNKFVQEIENKLKDSK